MFNKIIISIILVITLSAYADIARATTPLFKTTQVNTADTIEIIVIKVEFQEDNSTQTTGTGLFNSDNSNTEYNLDPAGLRHTNAYWQEHFAFADNYFRKVSNNQLVIKADIYPKVDRSYVLENTILDYNRTQKTAREKTAQYDSTRALLYMEFVADAIHVADSSSESPFALPLPPSNSHRVYMILHAGASRFIDGGSLGTNNADSPGDFMDFFISPEDFLYLKDSPSHSGDTLGVPLHHPSIDTLNSVLIVSETASQDKLNWGVNGIIINQIARSIGIPNTYDIVSGESRLGYFDLMDFAGYNSINGFLPVLPSAWIRSYMDWSNVITARPNSSLSRYYVAAHAALDSCSSTPCSEILKIPLNAKEYLLIENRQRSSTYDNTIMVQTIAQSVKTPYVITHDSLAYYITDVFSGVIDSVNSLDAGIPASGILIWHINEWYIEETLALGFVNATSGSDIADHYPGIRLIEADGDFSIGKNVSTMNYGSPSDLFPHVTQNNDTIQTLRPDGFANTQNIIGGYSNLEITVNIPETFTSEKNIAPSGDTIYNFEAPVFSIDISWNPLLMISSQWPVHTPYSSQAQSLTIISNPLSDNSAIIRSGTSGYAQLLNSAGESMHPFTSITSFTSSDPLYIPLPKIDTTNTDTIYTFFNTMDTLLATSAKQNAYFGLYSSGMLRSFTFSPFDSTTLRDSLTLPHSYTMLLSKEMLFVVDSTHLNQVQLTPLTIINRVSFPQNLESFIPHSLAVTSDYDSDGRSDIVITGSQGVSLIWLSSNNTFRTLNTPLTDHNEFFTVRVSDFDRTGSEDAFILGSQGTAAFISLDSTDYTPTTFFFQRSDSSAAALTDLNNNGYVDIVFAGNNTIHAIDHNGAPLKGFPFFYSKTRTQNLLGDTKYPPGTIQSQPLIFDITGDSIPEILSATPDGLLYAINHTGALSTAPYAQAASGKTSSSWPLVITPVSYVDSLVNPYGHLAAINNDTSNAVDLIISYHNYTTALRFPLSQQSQNVWLENSGNSQRTSHFNASILKKPGIHASTTSIKEFYLYPNPVTSELCKIHLELGADAEKAEITFFDVAGYSAFTATVPSLNKGANRPLPLEISRLGNGVYAVVITVTFTDGSIAKAWDRIGVAQ